MNTIAIRNLEPANDLVALKGQELDTVNGGIGFLAAAAIVVGSGALGIGAGYGLAAALD